MPVGGGHGPSQESDIRVFDLATLKWSSLYPPTPRALMTAANGDSDKGRWIPTGPQYARHSYNMALVMGRRYYVMTALGMPDHLEGAAPPWGGRICRYDFDTGGPAFSASPFDPAAVTRSAVGSGTLAFSDAASGTFSFLIGGTSRTKSITPMVFANPVPACSFALLPDPALASNFQDIWWASPAGAESGWG